MVEQKRLKILFCKGRFIDPISGSDEQAINYATLLRESGHSPSILLVHGFLKKLDYYRRLQNAGVPVLAITETLVHTGLRVARKLKLVLGSAESASWGTLVYRTALLHLKRERPDLVHVIMADSDTRQVIRAAHQLAIPVLYQEIATPRYAPEVSGYYDQIEAALCYCSRVAALSPRLAERCAEVFHLTSSVEVIPLSCPDTPRPNLSRRPPEDGLVFGFAGRLERHKGVAVLLDAFAQVSQRHKAKLKLAGVGPEKDALLAQARRLSISDRCEFLEPYKGEQGKSDFMASLDVFVQPSLAEGTPNTIVEAMRHGLPVVASAVGGIPDMLTPESGLLVRAGDSGLLAQRLIQLADDDLLRETMGINARRVYEELFSPSVVLPVLLSCYRRIIAANRESSASPCEERGLHPWLRVHDDESCAFSA